MELSATYTMPLGEKGTWFTYFGYPGEPALGPVAFHASRIGGFKSFCTFITSPAGFESHQLRSVYDGCHLSVV
jgi:hypothetical protein